MKCEAGGELLRSVSRSFYLTIALLPSALREPVGTAYLLARASDTIADTVTIDARQRLSHLGRFRSAVMRGEGSEAILEIQHDVVPADPSEARLIERLGECLALVEKLPEEDRRLIRNVIETILRGQMFDVERFGGNETVCALETAGELYGYTWLVAGCVGEFWTRICLHHDSRYSRIPPERLAQLGSNFGKGLQLVNILRDAPSDLRAGRCYLPAVQLRAAGLTPGDLVEHPARARPIADRWRRIAVRHLNDAAHYITAIRPFRIRLACFLPWYLGLRTLALLADRPSLEANERVKVSRNEVYAALALGALAVCSNPVIHRMNDSLSAKALSGTRNE